MNESQSLLYAGIGSKLAWFHIDHQTATVTRNNHVQLPAAVQYAWRHPSKLVLYVVSSNGGPAGDGGNNCHHATAWQLDPASGSLRSLGEARSLPARPLHCTVDRSGEHLLIAYNQPSGLSVHRLRPDGSLGDVVTQLADLDFGIFAHQVMVTPSARSVICVARGNDATAEASEDPGALKVFEYNDGKLSNRATVTPPAGGFGFGPRHLDFHANGRDVYLSVERQNELQHYQLDHNDEMRPLPEHTLSSLGTAQQTDVQQLASAVRVHPNGRFVYQANRSHAIDTAHGWTVARKGEDSLAVYELDPISGRPTLIQNVPSQYIHIRNLSLTANGELLVASTIQSVCLVHSSGGTRLLPPAIMLYRILDDGQLHFERSYELNTHGALIFWSGIISCE